MYGYVNWIQFGLALPLQNKTMSSGGQIDFEIFQLFCVSNMYLI